MQLRTNWLTREEAGWVDACRGSGSSPSGEHSNLVIVDPANLDLHISYSAGLEQGPVILRSGDSSPVMQDPEQPGSYTTDPDLQRIGAYFINAEDRLEEVRGLAYLFSANYILYGALESQEAARTQAENVLRRHFPYAEKLLEAPPRYAVLTFLVDIIRFIRNIPDELSKELGCLPAIRQAIQRDHVAAEAQAAAVIGPLYERIFPNYQNQFDSLRKSFRFKSVVRENLIKDLRLLILLSRTKSHEEIISSKTLGEPALMQSCGDLTMNEWNVAFVSGVSHPGHPKKTWTLLHAPGEPLNDRKYSCLIKWSCAPDDKDLLAISGSTRIVYPYQIATVQFRAPSLEDGAPDRHVFLRERPIGHLIEFAVYGRRVCREGRPLDFKNNIREFNDLRHIFNLPNLNPEEHFSDASLAGIPEYGDRPRPLFHQSTLDDVWLGESALVQGDRNLRVAALSHSIQLNVKQLGAPKRWIDLVLRDQEKKGIYLQNEDSDSECGPGQWRWITEGRDTWLEIFLLPSHYPCSMIGTQATDEGPGRTQGQNGVVKTESLIFLAHGHNYGKAGCTMKDSAEYIHKQGAWDALLFDEGRDVFQLVRPDSLALQSRVPLKRRQLRCVFWAHQNETGGST